MRYKSTRRDPLAMPCWIWSRALCSDGYGVLYRDGSLVLAHRFTYEQFVGPIPDRLTIDHLCRNRACVNPDHLEPVTNLENVRRGAVRKLSFEQAEEIRREFATGISMTHLALAYGVSDEAIRLIVRFKTYVPAGRPPA